MFTKVAENRFLDDILANDPGTIQPEKNEKQKTKNSKKRLLGPMYRSKLFEKNILLHIVSRT